MRSLTTEATVTTGSTQRQEGLTLTFTRIQGLGDVPSAPKRKVQQSGERRDYCEAYLFSLLVFDNSIHALDSAMSSHRDAEEGVVPNERAPLLKDATRRTSESRSALDQPESEEAEVQARQWPYYAWRGFLFVLAVLILAWFIKSWIDAGDTDVS
jgi:hypothetical protein